MPQTTPQDFDPIAYINAPHWQASRLGLDRIRELLARLGNPQNDLRIVHVAGTNGQHMRLYRQRAAGRWLSGWLVLKPVHRAFRGAHPRERQEHRHA